jgi:hypothetical protein
MSIGMSNWKSIEGFDGLLHINKDGQIKRTARHVSRNKSGDFTLKSKVLTANTANGYAVVQVGIMGKCFRLFVHKELAKAFIPNPNGYTVVNHKDGNKLNNTLENLEWCTKSWDNKHRFVILGEVPHNKGKTGASHNRSKPVDMLDMEGHYLMTFASATEAGAVIGADGTHISGVCSGKYGRKSAGGYKWQYTDYE